MHALLCYELCDDCSFGCFYPLDTQQAAEEGAVEEMVLMYRMKQSSQLAGHQLNSSAAGSHLLPAQPHGLFRGAGNPRALKWELEIQADELLRKSKA